MKQATVTRIELGIATLPLIYYVVTLLFYVLASASEGRWLHTMGQDDPKNFLGGIPHAISVWLMVGTLAAAPTILFLGAFRKKLFNYTALYATCFLLEQVVMREFTPWLGHWIMD